MTKFDQLLAKLITSPVEAERQADPRNFPQAEPVPEPNAKRERRWSINSQPPPDWARPSVTKHNVFVQTTLGIAEGQRLFR